jgi:hypothetical protein
MRAGSAMSLSSTRTLTVVPYRAAIADRVSPDLTTYVRRVEGDGLWLGDGVGVGEGDGLGLVIGEGDGLGLVIGEGDEEGWTEGEALPAAPGPVAGLATRATRIATRAMPMSASSAPWAIPRCRARMATEMAGRPRSRTTGVVRGIVNRAAARPDGVRSSTASIAARNVRQVT